MSQDYLNTMGGEPTTEQTGTPVLAPSQTAGRLGIAMIVLWGAASLFITVLIIVLIFAAIKFFRKRANG